MTPRNIATDLAVLRGRLAAPLGRAPTIALVPAGPALLDHPLVRRLSRALHAAFSRHIVGAPPPAVVDITAPGEAGRLREMDAAVVVLDPYSPDWADGARHRFLALMPEGRRLGVLIGDAPRDARRVRSERARWGVPWVHPIRLERASNGLRQGDVARLGRWLTGRAIGVALGGGGARAAAHVGVLDALDEMGVPVDALSGSSAGASMAALYAIDVRGRAAIEHLRERLEWMGVTGLGAARLPALGLIDPKRFATFAATLVGPHHFEDLPLPVAAVSTDVRSRAMRIHQEGPVWWGVLASAALPGLVPPVRDGSTLLVDGGFADNVPLAPLRAMARTAQKPVGVGAVIAVDVNPLHRWSPRARQLTRRLPRRLTSAMKWTVGQTARGITRGTTHARIDADVYIAPPLPKVGILSFDQLDAAFDIGRRTAGLD